MALTLAEASKLSNDVLLVGVIETIIKDSPILQALPFIEIVESLPEKKVIIGRRLVPAGGPDCQAGCAGENSPLQGTLPPPGEREADRTVHWKMGERVRRMLATYGIEHPRDFRQRFSIDNNSISDNMFPNEKERRDCTGNLAFSCSSYGLRQRRKGLRPSSGGVEAKPVAIVVLLSM